MVNRLFLLLIMMLPASNAVAAVLTAQVDRTELMQDEHLVLTISLNNSDVRLRAEGVDPNVDLSVLTPHFHVGTPRASNRYNINRGRGRSTSEIQVELFPKDVGTATIPSFRVAGLETKPITVSVSPLQDAPLAFSEAGVNQSEPWLGQETIFYLDVFHRVDLESAKLGGELETEPLALELFEYRRLPVTERTEQRHGFTYHVSRSAWSLFPHAAGTLTAYLPDVWIVTAQSRKLRLPHQRIAVDVRALPSHVPPGTPVGRIHVRISGLTTTVAKGENQVRETTIRGHVASSALPGTLPWPGTGGIAVYQAAPRFDASVGADGVENIVRFQTSAVSSNAGTVDLPALTLNYWDPDMGSLERADVEVPPWQVTAPTATAAPSAPEFAAPAAPASTNIVWPAAAGLLAVLWLGTVAVLLRQRRGKPAMPAPSAETNAGTTQTTRHSRPLEARLLAALQSRSLEEGLSTWQQRHGSDHQLCRVVRDVQQHYYGKTPTADMGILQAEVDRTCERICARPAPHAIDNTWVPENFTPATPSSWPSPPMGEKG